MQYVLPFSVYCNNDSVTYQLTD